MSGASLAAALPQGLLALLQDRAPADEPSMTVFVIASIVKLLVMFSVYMVGVALLTLAERKISAWIQDRHGPNRVGPGGLLQPAADGLKNIMKEETLPRHVNKPLFLLAPMMAFIPALITWAVIPFGASWGSPWGRIDMVLADIPIGFLFVLAISSLGVYGIVLAGWASNNKYSFLGGLRSSAQMVSYELALGLSTIPVLMLAGNVTLNQIVNQQASSIYNVFTLSVAAFIFTVAAFAETNRLPFDLPEAESELVAGYHSEYSAMKFSFFFIAEYAAMATMAALGLTLFLGGWDIPFTLRDNVGPVSLPWVILSIVIYAAKILILLGVYMWIRWTLPRFRYDQLMALGWKILLPMALLYIILVAAAVLVLDRMGVGRGAVFGMLLFLVNVVVLVGLFFFFDRGRLISPAYGRVGDAELRRLRRRPAPAAGVAGGGD